MSRLLPRILLAAIVGVAMAFVAIRSAATEFVLDTGISGRLPTVLGGDPRLDLASAMAALETPGQSPTNLPVAEATAAATEAPLAEEPFILAAVQALLVEEDDRAERLLQEARRREPRSAVVRLLLLALYTKAGRGSEAATELISLTRLLPGGREGAIPELARIAQSEGGIASTLRVLRADPSLRDPLFRHLLTNKANIDLILRLSEDGTMQPATPEAFQPWQSQLLTGLLDRGDVARARVVWEKFSRRSGGGQAIVDPNFRNRGNFPPFGWALAQTSDGVAEAAREGLKVEYYGRANTLLAEQLLTLKEGSSNRLVFKATRVSGNADGSLSWKLSCRESDQPILQIPVQDLSDLPQQFVEYFLVPPGCRAQWLRLTGSSLQGSKEQSVTFEDLQIQRSAAK